VAEAAVHSYSVAYRWGAGIFAFGAVLTALLFRRREPAAPENTTDRPPATEAEASALL
jgi:hypothetical protein